MTLVGIGQKPKRALPFPRMRRTLLNKCSRVAYQVLIPTLPRIVYSCWELKKWLILSTEFLYSGLPKFLESIWAIQGFKFFLKHPVLSLCCLICLFSTSFFYFQFWWFCHQTFLFQDDNSTGRVGPPLQGVQVRLIDWDEGNYRVTDSPHPRGGLLWSRSYLLTWYLV